MAGDENPKNPTTNNCVNVFCRSLLLGATKTSPRNTWRQKFISLSLSLIVEMCVQLSSRRGRTGRWALRGGGGCAEWVPTTLIRYLTAVFEFKKVVYMSAQMNSDPKILCVRTV